jgi:hypothetical protein
MTISELPPIKEAQVIEWAKIWGQEGKAEQAEASHRPLFLKWEILRGVMASKLTQILDLPEHPKVIEVRNYVTSLGYQVNEWGDESVLVHEIADLLRARVPEICHAYKEEDLPAWIRCATYLQLSATSSDPGSQKAFIEEGARAIELKIERLLPDNPIRLDETFANSTPEQMASYAFQIRDLARTMQPRRAPGRPKKSANKTPASAGNRSLDTANAARSYQMSLDGQTWRKIALAIYPNLSAEDRRSRKIEKRITRLIERGRLNAKKDGRNK